MSDILPRIQSGAKSRGENIRLITQGRDISNPDSPIDVYISISDTHFDIYKIETTFSVNAYSWFSLKKIFFRESMVNFEFNESKISIEFDDIEKVYEITSDILPRILKLSEMAETGASVLNNLAQPNPNSAILRLKQKIKYSKNPQNTLPIDIITDFITFHPYELDFSKIPNCNAVFSWFIDLIPLLPSLQTFVISSSFLSKNLKLLTNSIIDVGMIEHIEIKESITEQVENFINLFLSDKNSSLSAITYNNTPLTDANLKNLQQILQNKKITSLSLINCMNIKVLSNFHLSFINDPSFSRLTYLNLDSTHGLNLFALLPKITNIAYLSLSDCQLDVGKALIKFSNLNFKNLVAVNLSNNSFEEILPENYEFPQKLTKILIDNLNCGEESLQTLFKRMKENREKEFQLSVSNFQAPYPDVYKFLGSFKLHNLKSLVWDKNSVSQEFRNFVKHNECIEYLSVSGCFHPENQDFDPFCMFIAENSSIKYLVFRENDILEKKISDFVNSIIKRQSVLEFLDISDSKCGDEGLKEVKALVISEKAPKVLIADGASPNKSSSVIDYLNSALGVENDICVSYPVKDMEYLTKLKRISDSQLKEILSKYRSKEGPSDSYFDSPFTVYFEDNSERFPRFISNLPDKNNAPLHSPRPAPISPRKIFSNPIEKRADIPKTANIAAPASQSAPNSESEGTEGGGLSLMPAISSQASRSVSSRSITKESPKPVKAKAKAGKKAPTGKVARLTPSSSLIKLLGVNKREPLKASSQAAGTPTTNAAKSDSQDFMQSPLPTPKSVERNEFSNSKDSDKKAEIISEKTPKNSKSDKKSESEKESESTPIQGKNSDPKSGEKKRRRRHHSKKENKESEDWSFPIPKIAIKPNWEQMEKQFSMQEVELYLRQSIHN